MLTTRRLAGLLATLVVVVVVAACGGGVASETPTSAASGAPGSGAPTPAPSLDPNAPVGTDLPPGGGLPDPGTGDQFVDPQPGQLDVHPVAIDLLTAAVEGRHVVVTASWTSGVEPCYVLDTIVVDKADRAITITLREGHGPGDVVCIEIAMQKSTRIDLGELDPGTYTISDGQGVAPSIQVVVS